MVVPSQFPCNLEKVIYPGCLDAFTCIDFYCTFFDHFLSSLSCIILRSILSLHSKLICSFVRIVMFSCINLYSNSIFLILDNIKQEHLIHAKRANVKIVFSKLIPTIILLSICINTANAENYALLVGISKYSIKPLSGPVNDVTSLKKILNAKWKFKKQNIKTIINSAGTKKNILNSIKALYKKSKSGDNIFIYLSGHGTSSSDSAFKSPLPTTSGAFIPIDIENIKSKSELLDSLIIGRKDLKPLLQMFDNNGRHVFVAIDACFSGNTVRGYYNKRKLTTRFLSLDSIVAANNIAADQDLNTNVVRSFKPNDDTNLYPYKNIYYLAASGEYEPAQDIKPNMLDRYPTIDGKPHGAFSDTLLRVLNGDYNADSDHDGLITYSELKKTMRYFMRIRGFDHTPQGLPSLAEDQGKLATRAIFGHLRKNTKTGLVNSTKLISTNLTKQNKLTTNLSTREFNFETNILNIIIDKSLRKVRKAASSIKNIKIVNNKGQLEIRKKGKNILFISQAGDLIFSLVNPSNVDIIENIKHQIWIKQLVDAPLKQDFNIDLDMFASGRGSTVVEGDSIGVAIKSTKTAHILIVNINAQGTVNVLYPYVKSELRQLEAFQLLVFKELSKVVPPFGREYLQVYAFENSNQDYRDLMAKSFTRHSPEAAKLKRLLENSTIFKARTSLEVVTSELN